MTSTTTKIGSGRALFILPGDKFLNAIHPLVPTQSGTGKDEIKETRNERASR
jgi:hypothetical protein